MITRIVRMSFLPDKTGDFRKIFEASEMKIRQFKGCNHLNLFRDKDHPNVYFTLSHWESEEDLEAYRKSALFTSTWAKVKPLFNDNPKAYSLVDPDQ